MNSFFLSLGYWNWFILGAVLLALEVVAPGTFVLWLGVAAILVGLISLGLDWSWQAQLVSFGVLSVISLVMWRKIGRSAEEPTDQPYLNRRAERFVGRVFTLDKPIASGSGTVRVDDTLWRVTGPDSPAGSRVKVTRTEGALLVVERAPDQA